jgi:hypothetical protein
VESILLYCADFVRLASIDWPSSKIYPWRESEEGLKFLRMDWRLVCTICIQISDTSLQTVTSNEIFLQIQCNRRRGDQFLASISLFMAFSYLYARLVSYYLWKLFDFPEVFFQSVASGTLTELTRSTWGTGFKSLSTYLISSLCPSGQMWGQHLRQATSTSKSLPVHI